MAARELHYAEGHVVDRQPPLTAEPGTAGLQLGIFRVRDQTIRDSAHMGTDLNRNLAFLGPKRPLREQNLQKSDLFDHSGATEFQ